MPPPLFPQQTRRLLRENDPFDDDLLARSVNDTTSSPVRRSKRVFIAGTPVGPLRRTPLKSPRVSAGPGAGSGSSFPLQDFYVTATTPPPPSSPLRRGGGRKGASPVREDHRRRRGSSSTAIAQTDNLLSPWRIRVRVDAERDDDEEEDDVKPAGARKSRTMTTTVPLRGGDSSPPLKRGRGRPRKSDASVSRRKGTPRPNKTRRLSQEELEQEDLGQSQLQTTPKRSPGRPRKSIESDGTPRQTTPAARSPGRTGTSTAKSKRGRRKTMAPFNMAMDADVDADEDVPEPVAFADNDGYAILPNEEMMEEILQIDDVPSDDDEPEALLNIDDEDGMMVDEDEVEEVGDEDQEAEVEHTTGGLGAEDDDDEYDEDLIEGVRAENPAEDVEEDEAEEFAEEVENVEAVDEVESEEEPSPSKPISQLQPRSSLSPQKGRRRRSLLSQKSELDEDPTNHHREYDSIMESEGFSMVSLNTLPSAQHLRLQAVLEEDSEPPLPNSSQLSEELRTDYDPTVDVPDINSSHLANAIKHITPLKPASSPGLPPPPKVVITNNSPRALEKPSSGTPKLARVVRAGIALQGVVDEDEPEPSEPSKKLVAPSPTSKSPRERLDALFSGFGTGTQRELRAGLRLGEELAKRQRLAKQAKRRVWPREEDDDVFSDKATAAEEPKVATPQQYSLKVPARRNPTPSSAKANEQLPSPEDSGEVPEEDMMSWRHDTPRQAQLLAGAKQASLSPRRVTRASSSPKRAGNNLRQASASPQRDTRSMRASSSPQRATKSQQALSSPQRAATPMDISINPQSGREARQPSSSPQRSAQSKRVSASPQQRGANIKAKLSIKTQAQREAEWDKERQVVSQQIQAANPSQVVTINSDDPVPASLRAIDEEESEEDIPPPEPTIDIWQEEAKTYSSNLSFARPEEAKRGDSNDFSKPPRSKIPTPWRRQSNTQLVYSDEADMEETSWAKTKGKRPSPTPDSSPENRKRARFSSPVEQPSPEHHLSDEAEIEAPPVRPALKPIPASVEKRVRQQLLGEVLGPQKQAQKTPPRKQIQPEPIVEQESESEDEDANDAPPAEQEVVPQPASAQPSPPRAQRPTKSNTPQLAEPAEIKPKSRPLQPKSTNPVVVSDSTTSSTAQTHAQAPSYDLLSGLVQSVAALPMTVSSWFAPPSLSSISRLAFRPPESPTRATSITVPTRRETASASTGKQTGHAASSSSQKAHRTSHKSKSKSHNSSKQTPSEPFSLYLPWNLTHYRQLNVLYLDSLSHPSSYPLSSSSATAALLGTEVFSMGWRKPMSALELGVADAFLALLRREGIDDRRGRAARIDEHEVVKRVFSLWVGRVQRNETPLHEGVAGDWNARYKHLRKTQLAEQKRWSREMARLRKDRKERGDEKDQEEPRSPPHKRVQQLRADLL